MPYTPLEWKDGPEGGTPITAAALNRMEQGIVDAHTGVDAVLSAFNTYKSSLDPIIRTLLLDRWTVVPSGTTSDLHDVA